MLAQQVAKKYSTALFNLVREKGLVDQAFEQFEQLDNLINSDKALLQFLLAPHILEQDKIRVVREVFAPRLEPLFLEFLLVLIDKHRIGFLHGIIEEFRERVATARGIIVARIITAVPLDDAMRNQLIAKLKAKTGNTIELDEKVDTKILGGMIVILGDQIIDGSVKHSLSQLKDELMKLKVA